MTAIIVLGAVAALSLLLSAFLATALVRLQAQHLLDSASREAEHRQERSELVNRIQRPEILQATPADRVRNHDEEARAARRAAAMASVGTITHLGANEHGTPMNGGAA